MQEPLWRPSSSQVEQAQMTRFLRTVQDQFGAKVSDYPSLYAWSIQHPENFWTAVWDFCEVKASQPWEAVLENGDKMPGARWFVGSRLNFAENLLRYRDERPALVFRGEDGHRYSLGYGELYLQVARLAEVLKRAGVGVGDRVAGWMPNRPETIIAMLATTSLGAVWSSCSPDFGIHGVLDRFGQIEPKVLFAADGYDYKGKAIDSLARLAKIIESLPSLQQVIVVPYLHFSPNLASIPKAQGYEAVMGEVGNPQLTFAQLPFDHPVYILYSSGTTGVPKCIVHGAGGTLIQHLKELVLHTDLQREDRIFYYTTCGWMMWNWLVSALATGATVVLYDGAPFYPRPESLWDMAAEEEITVFGTSAKYLSGLEKAEVQPVRTHNLAKLRALLSTGSPLAPESFDYVYRDIKGDVQLSSISGGTDIVSCFALGNPILPVYRGELQCRGLGMKVEIFDEEGRSVEGQKGELVCTAPFPSMPVFFWNDPEGQKYRAAYFERFPGVWTHGDYAELTAHGGLMIYGRSDTVLNPGGVRIGTAEIYRQAEKLPEILESLAIGQSWQGDVRIILFVTLREGRMLDEALIARIKQIIRDHTSPRHVPAKVLQVPDMPRTISGKLVELAVSQVIHGRPVKNLDALANPETLDYFRDRPELQGD
ncbi:acetoacetyl-CoA synthase [Nitrosococcus halophilus Nc 4]|uniref:Acetoacetyl-CoA synthase n=1 Tax=Nitrosococcus halophilus (strain Nc4) TaxID=472759 RepID=D5BWD7_NITHN|nr:acetoacetate--CoA ligase [Nitrosococcus halophilus]ADE15594.1 acetoacetyl-CoA synthase [Nitrosococcus halophilus Nc 4]